MISQDEATELGIISDTLIEPQISWNEIQIPDVVQALGVGDLAEDHLINPHLRLINPHLSATSS